MNCNVGVGVPGARDQLNEGAQIRGSEGHMVYLSLEQVDILTGPRVDAYSPFEGLGASGCNSGRPRRRRYVNL